MHSPRAMTWLAAPAFLALASTPAAAQSLANDAKCFMVSNIFAKAKDAKAREAAIPVRYFYLGRLSGSASEIEAALVAQGKSVTAQKAGATMQVCARAVAKRTSEMQAIGLRLSKARPN